MTLNNDDPYLCNHAAQILADFMTALVDKALLRAARGRQHQLGRRHVVVAPQPANPA
ncbi:hypothetical protein [Bradyrhizobium sp. Ec3.3]|uniref:hypothetical protein n=1 Tax=Bradyrhizobium sp. Ec3.3 TaxID=189753 RepID=UPI0004150311|nr:hypothetical protein [Bradyrhizobium sp. Ec3.3]